MLTNRRIVNRLIPTMWVLYALAIFCSGMAFATETNPPWIRVSVALAILGIVLLGTTIWVRRVVPRFDQNLSD